MTTIAVGTFAKLAMDDALPFDASSMPFEFINETLRKTAQHVYSDGIRGTRSRYKCRAAVVREQIGGAINMNPTVTEIDWLLPKMLYGSTVTGVTDVAETPTKFQVMIDRVNKVFTYTDCVVSRWTLSGGVGQALSLTLEIEGKAETVGAAGSFPSLAIACENMFVFSDVQLILNSVAREMSSFALTMDNRIDGERFMNSLTRTELPALDRIVTLECRVPYTNDNTDLYDLAIGGIPGSLVVSDGTTTYTFAFANLKAPAESPVVDGRTEVGLTLRFQAFRDDAASECKVTKS